MCAMKLNDIEDQQRAQSASRRAPVVWPWFVVIAAWTLGLVATLTNQTVLIDHHYLLQQSHFPWPLALLLFLACWQALFSSARSKNVASSSAAALSASSCATTAKEQEEPGGLVYAMVPSAWAAAGP
jgi:hypothetical protein